MEMEMELCEWKMMELEWIEKILQVYLKPWIYGSDTMKDLELEGG